MLIFMHAKQWIQAKYGITIDRVIVYTDNCGGENKNRWFMNECATTMLNLFPGGVEVAMNESYNNNDSFCLIFLVGIVLITVESVFSIPPPPLAKTRSKTLDWILFITIQIVKYYRSDHNKWFFDRSGGRYKTAYIRAKISMIMERGSRLTLDI